MGRAEDRKKAKEIRKKLTPQQFQQLQSDVNRRFIDEEVNARMEYYKGLWSECLIEAFRRNGYTTDKAKILLDDIGLLMKQKVEEKRNGKA